MKDRTKEKGLARNISGAFMGLGAIITFSIMLYMSYKYRGIVDAAMIKADLNKDTITSIEEQKTAGLHKGINPTGDIKIQTRSNGQQVEYRGDKPPRHTIAGYVDDCQDYLNK